MRLILLMLCAVLIGGCVRSINPVLEDAQVGEYPELAGKWVAADGSASNLELIPDGKTFRVSPMDDEGKQGSFVLRIGKVGKLTVMECKPADLPANLSHDYSAQLMPTYTFAVLTQTQPKVMARTLKPDWLDRYVAEHPQELPMARVGGEAIIVASTKQLQAFIEKHWETEEAWTNVVVYVRPETATTTNTR